MYKHIQSFIRPTGGAVITAVLFAVGVMAVMSPKSYAQEEGYSDERSEREQFIKEIRRVENLNKKYTQQIQEVQDNMNKQQQEFSDRVNQLEEKLSRQQTRSQYTQSKSDTPQAISPELEEATYKILARGAELNPNDETFRDELAKAHYNMGNIFFQRGEYQRAVVEYFQAVDLSPYDPDIHYNLAFVSGEYLKDQETAMKHYHWYLYLKPDAQDRDLVNEKIAAGKLMMRAKIDSPLDKDRTFENVIR